MKLYENQDLKKVEKQWPGNFDADVHPVNLTPCSDILHTSTLNFMKQC
jgi:hypothetical protein